jgi:hypothetical protein
MRKLQKTTTYEAEVSKNHNSTVKPLKEAPIHARSDFNQETDMPGLVTG